MQNTRQKSPMSADDQIQTFKERLQPANMQNACHMCLSVSQQLWADSSPAQPSLVQHSCPTKAQGCRQGAEFVCDSSFYTCRSPSILRRLWPQ